jgi:hypothetical protein
MEGTKMADEVKVEAAVAAEAPAEEKAANMMEMKKPIMIPIKPSPTSRRK